MAFRFESLDIFHAAVDFSARVYGLAKDFPSEERFDLTSQARRAANSTVLNIAEGSGRGTKKDFSRFLDMAMGSIFETIACFFIARRQLYISQDALELIKTEGESLAKRINAFKGTLRWRRIQTAYGRWLMADSQWRPAISHTASGRERAISHQL